MSTLLLIHFTATAFMTGLIWCIQVVQYPSFLHISETNFHQFHEQHVRRISWVVVPVMCIELLSGIALISQTMSMNAYGINITLLIGIWMTTFLVSVPCHSTLEKGKNIQTIKRLVSTNWIRTVLWTTRALFLTFILLQYHP